MGQVTYIRKNLFSILPFDEALEASVNRAKFNIENIIDAKYFSSYFKNWGMFIPGELLKNSKGVDILFDDKKEFGKWEN